MEIWDLEVPKRYVVVGKNIYTLRQKMATRLWYDDQDVLWALRDDTFSLDLEDNCGINPFDLPDWHIFKTLNEECAVHDYLYSCPAFQYYHTRAEADKILEDLIKRDSVFSFLARPFRWLASKFGAIAWENKDSQ